MKNFRNYSYILFVTFVLTILLSQKGFSDENVFIIDNVKIEGKIDLNFSRDKHINTALRDSFRILMSKVLLTKDIKKVRNTDLKIIRKLINSFQIVSETYKKDKYKATFRILYNDQRVKEYLGEKNISFSQPKNIDAIFFPIFLINNEIQSFNKNFFYKNWNKIKIENELINYMLPLEDLDDISKIESMKNSIEDFDVKSLVNKYDVKNYVFALMDYNSKKLNIYIKTNFDNNETTKNIFYAINNINNEKKLNEILKNLKFEITDSWKESNVINLLLPLSITLKFEHRDLIELDKLKNVLNKIKIIDNFFLKEFNINHSIFKIYYYGSPKKLKTELFEYNFKLKDDKGIWEIYNND